MTNTAATPEAKSAAASISLYSLPERKVGKLEALVGPETYRLITGIFKNPLSVIGLVLISFFIVVAILAPVIAPQVKGTRSPYYIPRDGYSPIPKPPGTVWEKTTPPPTFWMKEGQQWTHIFGTASGAWDIYYGIVWGTRTALMVGVAVVGITLMVGIIVGAVAGFYGGIVDNILMRITEIFMTFPFLMAALTLSAILTPVIGKGVWPATIALVAFGWMTYARLVRGDVLSLKERDFVLAAKVVGSNDTRIMFRHIVPNAIYPTLVLASMNVGDVVMSFAALSFLGVGVEVGYADWGQIISFARNYIPQLYKYWYILIFPAFTLVLFVMGFNLMGDALRDIMDPKMRGRGN